MVLFWKLLPAFVAAAGLFLYMADPGAYTAFCSQVGAA